jgi:hypothetical protein
MDVVPQLARQIGHRGEDAARDDVALNLGEPRNVGTGQTWKVMARFLGMASRVGAAGLAS